ncbi:MAG: hypothetical protein PHR77_22165, partial [Kiritimatiellae bacterium]|nr:hypothetical protein [Kiritimatiellia bacterium]
AGVTGKGNVKVEQNKTSYQVEFKPYIRGQSTIITDNNNQTVVVKSGKQASIFMGHEVPFYQWLVDFGLKWNYINIIEQKFEMKQVGSALVVEPVIIGRGPLISIRLIPEISGVVDGKPHRIQYTRVATEITVKNGETVTIGSFGKNSEFYSKFLVGTDRQGNNRGVQVKLTAHILNPQYPPRNQ